MGCIDDGLRNFESRSKDENPTHNRASLKKLSQYASVRTSNVDRFNIASASLPNEALATLGFGRSIANQSFYDHDHSKSATHLNEDCQVIYSQFGLAIHQNDHQAKRRFVEWAHNEIAVVPDFHKRILFSDEAHFWLNGYVNKQNCRIWSEANPQEYVETPLYPEKLIVWCALWAGGILLQKR
ncbi:DUF4817 domain-containing protein [Trichonephila clavipes]|nr:DUF4817 domain-containing protein [Trichonephila clavipes]